MWIGKGWNYELFLEWVKKIFLDLCRYFLSLTFLPNGIRMMNTLKFSLVIFLALMISACQEGADSSDQDVENAEFHTEPAGDADTPAENATGEVGDNSLTLTDQQLIDMGVLSREIQLMRQSSRSDISDMVSEHGLSMTEFQQQSRLMTGGSSGELSPKEQEVWRAINIEMMEIQVQLESDVKQKVEQKGYTYDEYKEYSRRISQNPQYKERQTQLM